MRRVLFGCLTLLGAGAYAQTDSILWAQSFSGSSDETVLKTDSANNVYLGYVSGTPSFFTLKKLSPAGAVLWTTSLPYSANPNTKAQLVIGPDDDPYLGWASGAAELRRFDRLNGNVKWTITPPMAKFHFAIYDNISVYGDRPGGAQCLTYKQNGTSAPSTGPEFGFMAGQIWDGLVRYNIGASTVTQRMLIKTRMPLVGGARTQVIIGNLAYTSLISTITALGVNDGAPITRVIVGGPTMEGAIAETFDYGVGRTSFAAWDPPVGPPFTTLAAPIDARGSSRGSLFSLLNTGAESRYTFAADGSPFRPWDSNVSFPTGGATVGTFDGEGIYHSLRVKDAMGAVLDDYTLIESAAVARTPKIEIDAQGHALVSYIKDNGTPTLVVAKVWMAVGAQVEQKKMRVNSTATWDAGGKSRGFDDGTEDPHFTMTSPPTNGTATMDGDGKVTYTPNPNFVGQETIGMRVSKIGSSADVALKVFVKPNVQSITASDTHSGGSTLVTISYDQATPDFAAEEFAIKFLPAGSVAPFQPDTIQISGNQISGSKSFQMNPVTADKTVTVSATGQAGGTYTTTFLIRKAILESLTTSGTVQGGNKFLLRATLSGYAASARIVTLSDDSAAAATPATMTIASGAFNQAINVQTTTVPVNTLVTVTATLDGVTKTATVTILP